MVGRLKERSVNGAFRGPVYKLIEGIKEGTFNFQTGVLIGLQVLGLLVPQTGFLAGLAGFFFNICWW
ncbi:hypothetical protein ACT7C7_30765 [Bacillus cereus]